MLARVVERALRASEIDEVVIATTIEPADNDVIAECERLGVASFRGSALDVLDRYWQAAQRFGADAVIRITSDCPLIDPGVIDEVARSFLREPADYASNTFQRTYPRGLDAEIMTVNALFQAWRDARLPYQRTHVTPYLYQNPGIFKLVPVLGEADHSAYRWTVDTQADLDLVRAVYERLGSNGAFDWRAILQLMQDEPALVELNRHILQKQLQEG